MSIKTYFIGFSFILFPLLSFAENKLDTLESCYTDVKNQYLAGQGSIFETMSAGLNEQSILIKEDFARELSFASGRVALGSHFYKRQLKMAENKIIINVTFSKKNSRLALEETVTYLNQHDLPTKISTRNVVYDEACVPHNQSSIKNVIVSDSTDRATNLDNLLPGLYLGDLPTLDPFSSPFIGKIVNVTTSSGEPISFAFKIVADVKVGNINGSENFFEGVQMKVVGFPVEKTYYRSKTSSERINLVYANDTLNKKIESMSKGAWLADRLDNDVKVVGVSNQDILQPSLTIHMVGSGSLPVFFNSKFYFSTDSLKHQSNKWEIVASFANQKPSKAIAWNAPVNSFDRKYVAATSYIQTALVSDIAADLKLRLNNADRIEAATEITKEVLKRVKYNGATRTFPRTSEILKEGDGICYHFSVLFASIARELGIPTRMVGGYLIRENGLGAHAWNEIKIDETTWWPIEPQTAGGALFQRGYIPMSDISSGNQSTADLLNVTNAKDSSFGLYQIFK